MPRNSSGTYTLPVGAFSPGGLIKSADHNSNYSDIATALTQSVATTGVSTMTGPLKAAAGSQSAPSYAFSSDPTTGFYLAGTHQIGVTTNGTAAFFVNSDQSTTWQASATWPIGATVTINGSLTVAGAVNLNSTNYVFGAGASNAFLAGLAMENDVTVFLDGGGSAIQNSSPNSIIWVSVPCNMTVNFWSLFADSAGNATIDILDLTNSNTSIVGAGTKPNLSSAQNSLNNAPSSWTTTSLIKGHIYGFVTSGVTVMVRLSITLRCTRTGA